MTKDLFDFDLKFGVKFVAGVDEVGRGPLAGPVTTACCMLPLDEPIDKINDAKNSTKRAASNFSTSLPQRLRIRSLRLRAKK